MFPNEILLMIFNHLDFHDLGRCAVVSKQFQEISSYSILPRFIQNVTGLKEIHQAMKILQAQPILMECVWKFYKIHKDWQKEKHAIEQVHFIHIHFGYKFIRNLEGKLELVSCRKTIKQSFKDSNVPYFSNQPITLHNNAFFQNVCGKAW